MSKSLLEILFENFLPNTFKILADEKKHWKKFNSKLKKKAAEAQVGSITEASLPILLNRAYLGDSTAKNFLKFIDTEVFHLSKLIPPSIEDQFKVIVRTLSKEFDIYTQSNPNPAYLNWLAEVLALKKFLESGRFQLLGLEKKLTNGKSVDFHLLSDQKSLLVEVMSIHIPKRKIQNPTTVKRHIKNKLDEKISVKFDGLKDLSSVYILPVLFFVESLGIFEKYKELVIAPASLMKEPANGNYIFGSIESLKN